MYKLGIDISWELQEMSMVDLQSGDTVSTSVPITFPHVLQCQVSFNRFWLNRVFDL